MRDMPIGFFDSGVGGISVLREAVKIMPNENFIYFGDSINAPYGVREVEDVRNLTYKAVEFLLEKGAKAIAVACNTATSAAVAKLRISYPDLPIVGIEPAVKPAVKMHRKGAVIIMATPRTLEEKKFHVLMDKYKDEADIVPMPCAGLMEFVESGDIDGEDLEEYLRDKFKDYNKEDIAAIVLGCTHYPFVQHIISKVVGNDIPVIHGGEGTSRELMRRLKEKDLLSNRKEKGTVTFYNSLDDKNIIELSEKLLKMGN